MTLVSNHVRVSTVVISPNEFESYFAFDLLYNNTSEIQPKSLATDNHGISNVNFAIPDDFLFRHGIPRTFVVNVYPSWRN